MMERNQNKNEHFLIHVGIKTKHFLNSFGIKTKKFLSKQLENRNKLVEVYSLIHGSMSIDMFDRLTGDWDEARKQEFVLFLFRYQVEKTKQKKDGKSLLQIGMKHQKYRCSPPSWSAVDLWFSSARRLTLNVTKCQVSPGAVFLIIAGKMILRL